LRPQLQLKNVENWHLNNPVRRILGAYIRQRNQKKLEINTSQATILLFGQSFLMPIGAHI
jgi:hypothetical protein